MAHPPLLRIQIAGDLLRLLRVQGADEYSRHVKVGTHFHFGDRDECQTGILQVVSKDFDQRVTNRRAHLGSSARFPHRVTSITTQRPRSIPFFFLMALTPLA